MNVERLVTNLRRKFITAVPVKFMIRKSKLIALPGFSGIPLFDVTNFYYQQITKTSLTERAAAIAFNLVLAIPPAIIFLCTLIPFFPISDQFTDQLHQLVRDVIPGDRNNRAIISFLDDFINRPRTGLLSFGFLLALYFSTNAMLGISKSFNRDYIGFKKRNTFHDRWVAIKLTIILFFLVIMCITMLVSQDFVLEWLGIKNTSFIDILLNARWLIIFLLFFFIISFIYKYAPAVHKKWKLINPGSLLATLLMILFTLLFTYWVNHFASYNRLYGSIGTILIVMLIIYFNSIVLLVGFELNVSISSLLRIAEERNRNSTSGHNN